MGYSVEWLMGNEAAQQRMASRKPAFVVHAETVRTGMQELDAESVEHAHTIASAWCRNGMATSAAVRRVFPDGSLSKVVGRIHSDIDEDA